MKRFSLILCLMTPACGETRAAAVHVERTDSAGVEVVMNRGEDVPLPWRLEPVVTFGGEEDGPLAFFNVGSFVRADARGNIYLLDGGNYRILAFDADGRFLRSVGSRGGGPGEFEIIGGFAVEPDGTVSVYDFSKRGLVRWGPDGEILTSSPMEAEGFLMPHLILGDRRIVGEVAASRTENDVNHQELRLFDGSASTLLARLSQPAAREVSFENCPVRLLGMGPLLSPILMVDRAGEDLYVSGSAEYELRMHRMDGAIRRVIRRDLPLRRATVEDAVLRVPDPMRIRFGSGECRIPAAEVVEKQGYAEWVPAIWEIRSAPDGSLWVNRPPAAAEETRIDVISPDGEYLGTLPPETKFPATFNPDGHVVRIERDELDVERVVVYRVVRG